MPVNDKYASPGLQRNLHKKRKNINPVFPFLSSYPEVIKDNTSAENISIKGNEVWLEGVDEEAGPVSVDVHTVLLQELLLVSPAVRPVLCQLLHLQPRMGKGKGMSGRMGGRQRWHQHLLLVSSPIDSSTEKNFFR